MHAGIVCDSPGGNVKLTGTGSTCALMLKLPALCCGAQERRISWGCGCSSATLVPMLRKCQQRTSQVHRALSLALAPSMTLTWSWTAVVTHVSNDSTQLSDQHYASVRRRWLQERDGSCDRAPSLVRVRDGGGPSTSPKPPRTKVYFLCVCKIRSAPTKGDKNQIENIFPCVRNSNFCMYLFLMNTQVGFKNTGSKTSTICHKPMCASTINHCHQNCHSLLSGPITAEFISLN